MKILMKCLRGNGSQEIYSLDRSECPIHNRTDSLTCYRAQRG